MTKAEILDAEEQKTLEEFQLLMKDCLPPSLSNDDSIFYRFLKAREFDIEKAEKMLKKHINWWKAHQIDTILTDFKPKQAFCEYAEPSWIGLDKDGDGIVYSPAGKMDTKDYIKSMKMNDYLRNFTWSFEKVVLHLKEEEKRSGRFFATSTLIFDLDNLTFSNASSRASIELLLGIVHNCQENYPERLKAIYIINAPYYYAIIFSILKKMMSAHMAKKFHSFGNKGWREKILEFVDADVLPQFLGGNRTDPDGNPLCETFVCHGGKIPSIYHLSKDERYFKDTIHVKKISIPAKSKKEIPVEVTKSGSEIQWEFLVGGKDVGFGLDFYSSDQQVESILPIEIYTTADGTQEGIYKCQSVGKYILIFDNSHSWMTSKEIEYHVKVVTDQ